MVLHFHNYLNLIVCRGGLKSIAKWVIFTHILLYWITTAVSAICRGDLLLVIRHTCRNIIIQTLELVKSVSEENNSLSLGFCPTTMISTPGFRNPSSQLFTIKGTHPWLNRIGNNIGGNQGMTGWLKLSCVVNHLLPHSEVSLHLNQYKMVAELSTETFLGPFRLLARALISIQTRNRISPEWITGTNNKLAAATLIVWRNDLPPWSQSSSIARPIFKRFPLPSWLFCPDHVNNI